MIAMTFEILGILTSYGFLSVHTSAKIRWSADCFGFAQARGKGLGKGANLSQFHDQMKIGS